MTSGITFSGVALHLATSEVRCGLSIAITIVLAKSKAADDVQHLEAVNTICGAFAFLVSDLELTSGS